MKLVSKNVRLMQVFVIINKDGMRINTDVKAKNSLTKEYVIKDLIGFTAIVNVNVINNTMLENIQIMKIVNAEEYYLKNAQKILMRRNYVQIT